MSDEEFDVLDELYFIQSFDELLEVLDFDEITLKNILSQLMDKAWIKCYESKSKELIVSDQTVDLEKFYKKYHYLASKKGLLAHNGR